MGKNQHVTKHHDGGWQVIGEGNVKATARTNTQREAIDIARGIAKLFVYPIYDENKIKCFDLNIIPPCKETYTFNYDGLSDNKINVGEDICPGIYKIYATVINNDYNYSLKLRDNKGYLKEYITIWKKSQYSNEEGQNFSYPLNYYLEVPIGVTSIKFIKQ